MASACTAAPDGGGDDGGGDGGGGGGSGVGPGGGSGSGGSSGWVQMPLLGNRAGDDRVTGIYYASANAGIAVTQANQNAVGGAVFTTTATAVKALAFDGSADTPGGLVGGVDFSGITTTPTGYIALGDANDVVAGDAAFNFSIAANGTTDKGINQVLGQRVTATGTTMVAENEVFTATAAPGPTTAYTAVWEPEGNPSIPDSIPQGQCTVAPKSTTTRLTSASTYINADASLIAYTTSTSDAAPAICISRDHGASFTPVRFEDVVGNGVGAPIGGVAFANATTGISYWSTGNHTPVRSYVERTTDGGATWTSIVLPSTVTSRNLALNDAFFAPDGEHGWIVGYDSDASVAFAMVTTDGGRSWEEDATGMAAALGDAPLLTGFALDATHVWVGGEAGMLAGFQP